MYIIYVYFVCLEWKKKFYCMKDFLITNISCRIFLLVVFPKFLKINNNNNNNNIYMF